MLRNRVAAKRRLAAKRAVKKAVGELEGALEGLGIDGGVPAEVAHALERYQWGRGERRAASTLLRLVVVIVAYWWTVKVIAVVPRILYPAGVNLWGLVAAEYQEAYALQGPEQTMALFRTTGDVLGGAVIGIVPALMFMAIIYLGPAMAAYWFTTGRYPRWWYLSKPPPAVLVRRYRMVMWAAHAVIRLGRACGDKDAVEIQSRVSSAVSVAEDHVLEAYRRRGVLLPRRRRRVVREHGRQVVERLRVAELGLDSDPERAAREVARLLMTICQRYAEGRVGALLDHPVVEEADLLRIERVRRSRGIIRLTVFLLLAVGGVWGVGLLGLPDEAMGVAVVAVLVLAATLTRARISQRVQEIGGMFAP